MTIARTKYSACTGWKFCRRQIIRIIIVVISFMYIWRSFMCIVRVVESHIHRDRVIVFRRANIDTTFIHAIHRMVVLSLSKNSYTKYFTGVCSKRCGVREQNQRKR